MNRTGNFLEDKKMAKKIGTVEEALQDLRDGKVILVIDDPDRENEGDLICAAEFATQENVNFMACEAKGLICMPFFRRHHKECPSVERVKECLANERTNA